MSLPGRILGCQATLHGHSSSDWRQPKFAPVHSHLTDCLGHPCYTKYRLSSYHSRTPANQPSHASRPRRGAALFLLKFPAQTPHDEQPSTNSPPRIPRPPLFCRCLGIILRPTPPAPCSNASLTLRNSNLSRAHEKESRPRSVVPLGICDWDCNDRATLSHLGRACLCALLPLPKRALHHTHHNPIRHIIGLQSLPPPHVIFFVLEQTLIPTFQPLNPQPGPFP